MLVTLETGHSDTVTCMAVNRFTSQVATCSADHTIKIFDASNLESFSHQHTLNGGHTGPVCHVAWSHPISGDYLASCGIDHKVIIWKKRDKIDQNEQNIGNNHTNENSEKRENDWTIDYVYEGLETAAVALDFSPFQYGCKLIVASAQPKILIISKNAESWIVETLEESVPLGSLTVKWAPATAKGSIIKVEENNPVFRPRFAVAGMDQIVRIWEQKISDLNDEKPSWELAYELGHHPAWIRSLAWCPLLGDREKCQLVVGLNDGHVILWTFDGITCTWSMLVLTKGDLFVGNLAWSQCGSMLTASFGNTKTILLQRNSGSNDQKQTWSIMCSKIETNVLKNVLKK